jgi:hypothetical protein
MKNRHKNIKYREINQSKVGYKEVVGTVTFLLIRTL